MEKPGKASEWLYHDVTAPSNVATEAGCCPCIVYGRSNLRLKTASDKRRGRDITERPAYEWAKPPTYPLMSAHCCAFASCLPLYGVFLASLRGQVRHFYGIQGSDSEDFKVGCCCPADTVTQIENEIILREGKRRRDSDGTITSGYQTPTPMTSPSSSSSSSCTTTRPDTPDTECDDPLPCIPEDSEGSTCPPTTVSSRRPSSGKGRERSIARDPMAPTDATLVHNHDLDRDPRGPVLYKPDTNHGLKDDPSSVMYPPAIHRLSKDTKSPAGPAIIPSPSGTTSHRPPRLRSTGLMSFSMMQKRLVPNLCNPMALSETRSSHSVHTEPRKVQRTLFVNRQLQGQLPRPLLIICNKTWRLPLPKDPLSRTYSKRTRPCRIDQRAEGHTISSTIHEGLEA
ncbi:hypothetical protein NM208_g13377 [Fusarium decemcellulare]|uniref:Uncharacterized protein n=1 Tax=Fusarium decemcellulare TaxID=57161 RepID=A0ACC1RLV8_9HYPO|nr:hypothetical protein NM208_g13377 [Fusarium decemcellulare]